LDGLPNETESINNSIFIQRIDAGDLGGARFVGWVPKDVTI